MAASRETAEFVGITNRNMEAKIKKRNLPGAPTPTKAEKTNWEEERAKEIRRLEDLAAFEQSMWRKQLYGREE